MTAIWQNDGAGWHLLAPTGFPTEKRELLVLAQLHYSFQQINLLHTC